MFIHEMVNWSQLTIHAFIQGVLSYELEMVGHSSIKEFVTLN